MTRRPRNTSSPAAAKPSVIVVDDHPIILRQVSDLLASEFDVVAVASDGRQAVDLSRRLRPDLMVLDIAMPGLDGFETAEELQRIGSRARIVFSTLHDEEAFVAGAYRAGGWAFVPKTQLAVNLVRALHHVREGRRFVHSLPSLLLAVDGPGHAAHFHQNEDSYIEGLGSFVHLALRRGDAVALVAAASVRAEVAKRLRAHGWRAGESGEYGRYRAMDAADALAQIMRDGRPDAARIAEVVGQLEAIRRETAEGPSRRFTLVGEIAVPLLLGGNPHAALEVERLWNAHTHGLPFLSVCCYPMRCFSQLTGPALFPSVCAEHWAVGHT